MSLCQYSDIFGRPNTGVHAIRILDIAIVDFSLTVIGAYLIYLYVNKRFQMQVNYFWYLLCLFILGVVFHRLFCVRTTIDKLIFRE